MANANTNNLLPCDVRRNEHSPGRVSKTHGIDRSGTITYAFNSAGYRGEDYNPDARLRICVIGESHAFGIGVAFEQTFAGRFRQHVAAALGEAEDRINLINLSVGGSSADYCARTLIRQMDRVDLDFVICLLPNRNRVEYFSEKKIISYNSTGVNLDKLDEAPDSLIGFLEFYTDEFGEMNQIKNVLMMQSLFRQKGVNHLVATHDLARKNSPNRHVRPLVKQLRNRHVLRHEFFENRADLAADGKHAGPRTHGALAIALLARYAKLLEFTGKENLAKKIGTHAEDLMRNDKDWAFYQAHVATCTVPDE